MNSTEMRWKSLWGDTFGTEAFQESPLSRTRHFCKFPVAPSPTASSLSLSLAKVLSNFLQSFLAPAGDEVRQEMNHGYNSISWDTAPGIVDFVETELQDIFQIAANRLAGVRMDIDLYRIEEEVVESSGPKETLYLKM